MENINISHHCSSISSEYKEIIKKYSTQIYFFSVRIKKIFKSYLKYYFYICKKSIVIENIICNLIFYDIKELT